MASNLTPRDDGQQQSDPTTLESSHLLSPSPPLSPAHFASAGQTAPLMMDHLPSSPGNKETATELMQETGSSSSRSQHDHAAPAENITMRAVGAKSGHGFFHTIKLWSAELVWVVADIVLLVALIILLSQFNGRPMPEWPMGLTLNTVVAVLSTVSRSMTIVPLVEAMSQLKWNWFASKERQLRDVYLFDQATRGPWGALVLIFKTRGRLISFAWIAAFILISGLATSFLTQSAISYTPRYNPVPSNETANAVPVAPSWPVFGKGSNITVEHDPSFAFGITRSAFQAAFYQVDETWDDPVPHCPSSKCNWPATSTIAICASVANITDHLSFDTHEKNVDASLPDGLGVLHTQSDTSIRVNMTAPDFRYPTEEEFQQHPISERWNSLAEWKTSDVLTTAFSQFTIIYSNNNNKTTEENRFRAAEVVWHLCVNTYDVTYNETEQTVLSNASSSTTKVDKILHPGPKFDQEESSLTMLSDEGNGPFNVSVGFTFEILRTYFKETLTGSWDYNIGQKGVVPSIHELVFRNMYEGVGLDTPDDEYDDKTFANLWRMSNTIATAMTSYVRTVDPERGTLGKAFQKDTIITIRWEWLTLLIVQIGLTLIFVLGVMFQTSRLGMDVVKSSNTAELFAFQGANNDKAGSALAAEGDGLKDSGINTVLSPTLAGKLVKGERGWKLKLSK